MDLAVRRARLIRALCAYPIVMVNMQNEEQLVTVTDKIEERIYPEIYPRKIFKFLEPSSDRLNQNLDRASNLVEIYRVVYGEGKGRRNVHKIDLLRAAVVFIHASL